MSTREDGDLTVSVLGAGGHQGKATLSSFIDDVWNTDLEHGLLSKRDEVGKIVAVERSEKEYENIEESLSEDPEELEDPDEAFVFENEWDLVEKSFNSKVYRNEDVGVELEFVNEDAVDYLQNGFDGGLVYDGVWTDQRERVASALADRLEGENTALLAESTAELFEKPSGVARDEIFRLQELGIPLSENQVEMYSRQKKSTIEDIRESDAQVQSIETYRMSEPEKMVASGRNLLKHSSGSMHDKGIHDWGKILSTLAASGQFDENESITVDEESSVYRKAIAELGEKDIAYREDGIEVSDTSLDDPSSDGRINDAYSEAKAEINDVDIKVATSLTGWTEDVEMKAKELEGRFDLEEHEVKTAEGLDIGEEVIENIAESSLIYERDGGREIRAEHIQTDEAEYLVSTGGEMYTLKKDDEGITLLAYGGSDWHAEFLEEGIDAAAHGEEMTVDIASAVETNRVMEEVTDYLHRNAQRRPMRTEVSDYEGLREVIAPETENQEEGIELVENPENYSEA
jgi:hypothetical protein